MKTIQKSTLKESGDSDLIFQGKKCCLVLQPNKLYYIYVGNIEVAIYEKYHDALIVVNSIENVSCEIVD
jgi:hypothetical protein